MKDLGGVPGCLPRQLARISNCPQIGGMFPGWLAAIRNSAIDVRSTMTSFTIELPEEHVRRLRDLAHKLGTTPEDVLCAGVQEWLTSPATDFARAASYVLKKNAELYRRLS